MCGMLGQTLSQHVKMFSPSLENLFFSWNEKGIIYCFLSKPYCLIIPNHPECMYELDDSLQM